MEQAARHAPGQVLHLRGFLGLPTAGALGTILLAPRGIRAAWLQRTPVRPEVPYTLDGPPAPSGFHVWLEDHREDAKDLAILINVSEDTVPAVRATPGLPQFRGRGAG